MEDAQHLPDHLIALPDETHGRWALWRDICLRGAGFPAADVLRIADAQGAAAADRLNAVEDEAEALREDALAALRAEKRTAATKERLDLLAKAIRRVKRSLPPAVAGLAAETVAAIDAWGQAVDRAAAERTACEAAYAAAEERIDGELRQIAGDHRFREAVAWQNRHAAETGLAAFLRRPAGARRDARHRGHVQLLASYLQRYCTKNDTIGFFGPVGLGTLSAASEAMTAVPGPDLVTTRQVYFEGWAIDALADLLAQDEAMRPWLAPRLSPFLRRQDGAFFTPQGQKMGLGPLSTALVAACDGTRPAKVLVRQIVEAAGLSPDQEALLWGLLAKLHQDGLLRWAFQIPLTQTPERTFREILAEVEDEPLRERALALLDELERGRDAVARAAGKADELTRALAELEAAFTRITGKAATQMDGHVYAGRTLVYEDCRRDLEIELGAPFLAALAPPLSLVLASSRWFTHHVAERHRAGLRKVYDEMTAESGPVPLDFLAFTLEAMPRQFNEQAQRELQAELHARWERALAPPAGAKRVSYRSEDLRARVEQEFAAPGPGWQKARNHSPDLLIAAPSVEAIRQGDYQIVLGEIHLAVNSLDRELFFGQHPHPERLAAAIESDLPEPSVIPKFAKYWHFVEASTQLGMMAPAVNSRMDVALRSAKDFYLDYSLDPPGVPTAQLLPIADLLIEAQGDRLVVRPRDGRVAFEVIDFYQLVMMMQLLVTFELLPEGTPAAEGTHTPRITIDRMVVARESWAFPAEVLAFANAPSPALRFAAARRWAHRLELPRFVFVKTPTERKPFYLDFESPVLVETFAKAIRHVLAAKRENSTVKLTEMLPGQEELWLTDAAGKRYTAELRLVALDRE